jgi:hypothetical protein
LRGQANDRAAELAHQAVAESKPTVAIAAPRPNRRSSTRSSSAPRAGTGSCCVARPEAVVVADRLAVSRAATPGLPWRVAVRVGTRKGVGQRTAVRPALGAVARLRPRRQRRSCDRRGPRIRTARRWGSGPAERDSPYAVLGGATEVRMTSAFPKPPAR